MNLHKIEKYGLIIFTIIIVAILTKVYFDLNSTQINNSSGSNLALFPQAASYSKGESFTIDVKGAENKFLRVFVEQGFANNQIVNYNLESFTISGNDIRGSDQIEISVPQNVPSAEYVITFYTCQRDYCSIEEAESITKGYYVIS